MDEFERGFREELEKIAVTMADIGQALRGHEGLIGAGLGAAAGGLGGYAAERGIRGGEGGLAGALIGAGLGAGGGYLGGEAIEGALNRAAVLPELERIKGLSGSLGQTGEALSEIERTKGIADAVQRLTQTPERYSWLRPEIPEIPEGLGQGTPEEFGEMIAGGPKTMLPMETGQAREYLAPLAGKSYGLGSAPLSEAAQEQVAAHQMSTMSPKMKSQLSGIKPKTRYNFGEGSVVEAVPPEYIANL